MRYFVVVKSGKTKHRRNEVSGFAEMKTRMQQEKNYYSCASIVGIRVNDDCGIDLFALGEFNEPGNNAGDVSDGGRLDAERSEGCGTTTEADKSSHDRPNDGSQVCAGESGHSDRVESTEEAEETEAVYCPAQDYCGL